MRWRTKSGEIVEMEDMNISHIANALNYVLENRLKRPNLSKEMRKMWRVSAIELQRILRDRNINNLLNDETDIGIGIEITIE